MEKDPVCGMLVKPEEAAGKAVHEGKTSYFCSPHCMKRFQESPQRFVTEPGPGAKK